MACINVPRFKNTYAALDFGKKYRGDVGMISILKERREELLREVRRRNEAGDTGGAIYLASGQCQFVREAIEEAEKQ